MKVESASHAFISIDCGPYMEYTWFLQLGGDIGFAAMGVRMRSHPGVLGLVSFGLVMHVPTASGSKSGGVDPQG